MAKSVTSDAISIILSNPSSDSSSDIPEIVVQVVDLKQTGNGQKYILETQDLHSDMDRKVGAASQLQAPVYDDFEPLCYWRREDGHDTLIIHLPEFRREELKIQISNTGILKITGERAVEATKRSRFLKEIKVTKDYNANNIHAKFSQGRLHVTFPKTKISSISSPTPSQKPLSTTQQSPVDKNKTQNDQVAKDNQKSNANASPNQNSNGLDNGGNGKTTTQMEKLSAAPASGGDRVLRSKRLVKVAVGVGVGVVVAFGVYFMYKYWPIYIGADHEV